MRGAWRGVAVLVAGLLLPAAACAPRPVPPLPEETGTASRSATSTTATGTAETSTTLYAATLQPLNGSGVQGRVWATVRGDSIAVRIDSTGLEAGRQHPQDIHGYRDGTPSKGLPPNASVDVTSAESYAGPILLALEPYPFGAGKGQVLYEQTFGFVGYVLPLGVRAVILHGMTRGGGYDFTFPVAFGLLKAVPVAGAPEIEESATPGGAESSETSAGANESSGAGSGGAAP